jgi:hypothetical protein
MCCSTSSTSATTTFTQVAGESGQGVERELSGSRWKCQLCMRSSVGFQSMEDRLMFSQSSRTDTAIRCRTTRPHAMQSDVDAVARRV